MEGRNDRLAHQGKIQKWLHKGRLASLTRLSQAQGLPEVAAGKKAGEWERQRSGAYKQRGRSCKRLGELKGRRRLETDWERAEPETRRRDQGGA